MKKILIIIIVLIVLFIGYSIMVTPSYETLDISHAIDKAKVTLKDNQEIVVFDSKNPFNFYDVFHRVDKISDQRVFGILTKPDNIGIFPVIIGVAGSVGWGELILHTVVCRQAGTGWLAVAGFEYLAEVVSPKSVRT